MGDFLLEELERNRDVHMRDIVATIQADQYRLITHDADTPLVIQGGPGTGKTAVGLHRASWLLYTQRETLRHRGVLVVGPNRTFMEYVSHVLPALGEDAVEQRAVGQLVDGVEPDRRDPPDVARLKADGRLVEVIRRAADLRLVAEPEEVVVRLEGSFIAIKAREVRELLEAARDELGTTAAARERFRMNVLRLFYERYGRTLGGAAFRNFDEVEQALRSKGYLDRVLRRPGPSSRRTSSSTRCSARAPRWPRPRTASWTTTSSGCSFAAAPAGPTPTSRCSTKRARCSPSCHARTGT